MAIRPKTIEFAFDTNVATLATNTTLGTATRYDFAAITVYIPESTLTFKSVILEITERSAWPGTVRQLQNWRFGIKLGAVAFSDQDTTFTAGQYLLQSFGQDVYKFSRDVTSYFTTNWSGTSMTCQAGVAFATDVADIVNNITAKLIITYTYDDTSSTQIKSVRIPIQSHHTSLTNAMIEIGTTGGANNAPANQIPQLSTFLPESGVTIRQAFIEVVGCDNGNGTDHSLSIQIDSGGTAVRAVLEDNGTQNVWFKDIYIYDTTTNATSSAHAFKLDSSVNAANFPCIGAILTVTYEFTPGSTTTVLNSLKIPLDCAQQPIFTSGTTTANTDRGQVELWVEEPSTITLVQSGLMLYSAIPLAGGALVIWGGGQAERTYTWPGSSDVMGQQWFVHRTDQGTSPWSLSRGYNSLKWNAYSTTAENIGIMGGFAIINYTSAVAAAGVGAHNQSCCWDGFDYPTSGAPQGIRTVASGSQKFPSFGTSTAWFLNSLGIEKLYMLSQFSLNAIPLPQIQLFELQSGEGAGDGWLSLQKTSPPGGFLEVGPYDTTFDLTAYCNRTNVATGKIDPTASRATRVKQNMASLNGLTGYYWWATFSGVTFTVSGTVTGYPSGDGSGITVDVYNNYDHAKVAEVTTVAGGGYTATVYDSANTHFTEARVDSTHLGRSDNVTPS